MTFSLLRFRFFAFPAISPICACMYACMHVIHGYMQVYAHAQHMHMHVLHVCVRTCLCMLICAYMCLGTHGPVRAMFMLGLTTGQEGSGTGKAVPLRVGTGREQRAYPCFRVGKG
jgi:hypothetical protein